ncbi:MAG: hypothetical protein IJ710_01655, partial [Prevotella sp.]|nr:hypothetical protein [Prevotella sp.]
MKHRVKQIGFAVLAAVWSIGTTAQVSVDRAEYWLDHDFDGRSSVAVVAGNWTQQLDLSALSPGLHNVGFRLGTADGRWSAVLVKNFLVPQPSSLEENTLQKYEYWIDHQFDARTSGTIAAGGVIELQPDFSSLAPGLHNIAFRVLDANGHSSSILVKNFLVPQPSSLT